jgi:hypothetical protein
MVMQAPDPKKWEPLEVAHDKMLSTPAEALDWLDEALQKQETYPTLYLPGDIIRVTKLLYCEFRFIDHLEGLSFDAVRANLDFKAQKIHAQNIARQRDELEKALQKEREDHNLTRDVLFQMEARVNRLNGYVDGLEDSKPPVMVPDHRDTARTGAHSEYESVAHDFSNASGYGHKPRRWYHR